MLHLYPEEANMGESLDWTELPDTPPICTLTTILHYAFKTEHAQYTYTACKKAVYIIDFVKYFQIFKNGKEVLFIC